MRYRSFTVLSGVIAALALAQCPAVAIDLLGNDVGVDAGGGSRNVSANIGNTTATVGATTGGASTANVTANVSNRSSSALPDSLSSTVNIDLDDAMNGGRATVDLNGDGVIDEDDTAMARLDINGDGLLNVLDDANDDGVLSSADLDAMARLGRNDAEGVVDLGLTDNAGGAGNFRIGGLPVAGGLPVDDLPIDDLPSFDIGGLGDGVLPDPDPGPGPRPRPGPGPGADPIPGVEPPQPIDISDAMRNLNDADLRKFKVKCVTVMANPNAFSATTVEICKTLASL